MHCRAWWLTESLRSQALILERLRRVHRLQTHKAGLYLVMGDTTMSGFSPSYIDQAYAAFKASQPVANPAGATTAPAASTDASARNGSTVSAAAAAEAAAIQAGDALVSKLKFMPIYAQPNKTASLLTNLSSTDQVIYLGEERNGLYRVGTPAGDGWADKLMLRRAQ